MSNIKCCFIGHRKIEKEKDVEQKVEIIIEDLILKHNANIFLLGSRSNFDALCHSVLCDLKKKYPNIKLVAYTCRHETAFLECEKEKWEEIYSSLKQKRIHLLCVDERFEHKTKWTSGKASYIERNQAMIDDSDYCVFYYNENYLPSRRKRSKGDLVPYQPKSGTSIAYMYAKQKKKKIINVFES